MSRFDFLLAENNDDAELRQRMAEDYMPGDISLSFRREPSYFLGSQIQGETVQVAKCIDRKSNRIIGLGCRALSLAWINGKLQRVGYLADLRAQQEYRGSTLLARGYRFFRQLHQADPVALYYTMILEGNVHAQRLLSSGRCGLPMYRDIGRFLTPAIFLDVPRSKISVPGIHFTRARQHQLREIFQFVQRWHSRKQLAPTYSEEDISHGRLHGLRVQDIYLAMRGNQIVAVCAAWDQCAFRQTHIEGYSKALRFTRPLYNSLAAFTSLKPLPPVGSMVPYFYLALVAVENNEPSLFAALLRHVYRQRRNDGWHYFIVGLHERDPLAQVLQGYRRIQTAGRLYVVHYPEDEDEFRRLDDRIPYIEIASV
jgi:hypothetical protein